MIAISTNARQQPTLCRPNRLLGMRHVITAKLKRCPGAAQVQALRRAQLAFRGALNDVSRYAWWATLRRVALEARHKHRPNGLGELSVEPSQPYCPSYLHTVTMGRQAAAKRVVGNAVEEV